MPSTEQKGDKRLLAETEVEHEYGLTRAWLRRCRLERRGPRFLKFGRLVRYRRSDVEAYLDACTVETAGGGRRG